MEPWLDSLSEDWKSEHRSSSPSASVSSRRQNDSLSSSKSQSRIPHLAQNIRKESASSFLKPRSTRGLARVRNEPILSERSASSLNLPPQSHAGSQKRMSVSTLPRRASSVFSESQNSVQHYTVHERPDNNDTPDWKRRLANGEDIASDGFDLFAPSKLEGMFKQPSASYPVSDNESSLVEGLFVQIKPFDLPPVPTATEQYQSLRASRTRPPGMEVLEEVDEDDSEAHALSAVSSDLVRNGSIRGIVRQRVLSLERVRGEDAFPSSPPLMKPVTTAASFASNDPRWRTISGQQEMMNEYISPVTVSRQNTIRDKAILSSMDMDVSALDEKLAQLGIEGEGRPSSRSSDRIVSYGHRNASDGNVDDADYAAELTSLSLPEDLSMGTQEFASHGGFVNQKRGGHSNEASFLRRILSSSADHSKLDLRGKQKFRSSPPPYNIPDAVSLNRSKFDDSLPTASEDGSVVHHEEVLLKPTPSGSPLKLFGNRDTYTNNKLLRILSQFEGPGHGDEPNTVSSHDPANLRMSQFGRGELDKFNFENHIKNPPTQQKASTENAPMIFNQPEPAVDTQLDAIPQVLQSANSAHEAHPKASSPSRTPKRRRTLLRDESTIDQHQTDVKIDHGLEDLQLAGKKRKDARPGDTGAPADAHVLASRTLLQPRSSRRNSLNAGLGVGLGDELAALQEDTELEPDDLKEALAAELASFAQSAAEVHNDSRKASLATKDYMEEANKVMEFIRARGKPTPRLPEIEEPPETSELNPDAIIDLDIDDESTKEGFSRPPSREGFVRPSPDRRHVDHDAQTASYLRKYKDEDDLELLANTSGLGNLQLVDNIAAKEASLVPIPNNPSDDDHESNPPNIRILNHNDTLRKRKHSTSTVDGLSSVGRHDHGLPQSSDSSTRQSFPTSSSSASGNKGMITSGTVSIPDRVGTMTFDHERKVWVQKAAGKSADASKSRKQRQTNSEADPFEHIPDLSIDEKTEQDGNSPIRKAILEVAPAELKTSEARRPTQTQFHLGSKDSTAGSGQSLGLDNDDQHLDLGVGSFRSEASKHEARLHDGIPSKPPAQKVMNGKQARVVTIAFTSPLVSAVNYQDDSIVSDADLEGEVDLPLDDSEISVGPEGARRAVDDFRSPSRPQSISLVRNSDDPHEQYRAMGFSGRPVSRIEELDEGKENFEMSLVHIRNPEMLTPAPAHQLVKARHSKDHASSILCLTPLSDFSLHQVDNVKHPEDSFVEERPNPKALRQAHGSLALAVDTLVKAITDAEPTELYWEHVRRLRLGSKGLSALHGLSDYCSSLEELSVVGNEISQLSGLPSTLRALDIRHNTLTSLTSWGQLQNLQYVDVSNNQLDSLEGFSSLVHLRRLIANDNNIRDIGGVLDLDGLLELQLCGNELTEVDFDGSELVRLTKLDLRQNQLRKVKNLQELSSLEDFKVAHNKLASLGEFGTTTVDSLHTLDISDNIFQTLDLSPFPNVKLVNGDRNNLTSLHGLEDSYHLQSLSLRDQSGSSDLVNSILSVSNECRQIFLSSNPVPSGKFKTPVLPQCNLRELEIAGCGISELPSEFGDYFPNCRKLNLNFNALTDICDLQGMSKLAELLLARNRIKRLRRTCLVLSRLGNLKKVDIRDNTLTLGFYAPLQAASGKNDTGPANKYILPEGSKEDDAKWSRVLDEITSLRRRTVELLLAEGCGLLKELDGLYFARERASKPDQIWQNLTAKGVLQKPDPQQTNIVEGEAEMEGDDQFVQPELTRHLAREPHGNGHDADALPVALGEERSLTVE